MPAEKFLDLSRNSIGDAGVAAFGLWLQDNGLDPKVVEKLRTAAAFKGTRVKLE